MQNLSTTYLEDIKLRDDLFIPSGSAKISFIDTRDIGEIIGRTLSEKGHENRAYAITGSEAITYFRVADTAEVLLKRKPRTIEDFIKDHVEVWT